jgi:hypothetical protein
MERTRRQRQGLYQLLASGQNTPGVARVRELFGEKVADKCAECLELGVKASPAERAEQRSTSR